jgi:hypothetical protein
VPHKLNVLISFAHIGKGLDDIPTDEWNIMLDSGAFTNFTAGRDVVKLDDYIAFVRDNQARLWHAINLDVIGNPQASKANFDAMQGAGLAPVPVFQRGDTFASLEQMFATSKLVAIGGISQNMTAGAELDYLRNVMRRVQNRPVHLLGIGWRLLAHYRPYSGDNSTWACRTVAQRFNGSV